MPELPEVETIKRQLFKKIVGKKMKNRRVIDVRRRAKLLIIDFSDKSSLVFHLKLTGQLIFNGQPSRYTREVFSFDDGSRLIFNDTRKLGWWKRTRQTEKIEKKLGPDALEIDIETFKKLLKKRLNSKIKNLLMDQGFVAGIGNIYSDEILFASKVRPSRRIKKLTSQEIGTVFHNIKKILKSAIRHKGSSVRYYRDACGQKGSYVKYHKVYHQKKCHICSTGIKRIKIGGRTAHYCPTCQPS